MDEKEKHRAEEKQFNQDKRKRVLAARDANMASNNGTYLAPEHPAFNQEYPSDGPNPQSNQYVLDDDGQPVSIDPRSMQQKFEGDMDYSAAEEDGLTFGGSRKKKSKKKKNKSKKSKKSTKKRNKKSKRNKSKSTKKKTRNN